MSIQNTTPPAHEDAREDLDGRLGAVEAYLSDVGDAAGHTLERLATVEAHLLHLVEAMAPIAELARWNRNEMDRLSPQLAALEARVERRERAAAVPAAALSAEQDGHQVDALLEEVRQEHERTRARLSYLSSFEERLRRLETR